MYRIMFGAQPSELVHEIGYTTESRARDVYRDLSFNRYAVLMCGDDVIDDNLKTGRRRPRRRQTNETPTDDYNSFMRLDFFLSSSSVYYPNAHFNMQVN